MRVLFVDQFGELGGAQRCLLDLIPGVTARSWKPYALVPPHGGLRDRLTALGVQVHPYDLGQYRAGSKTPSDAARYVSAISKAGLLVRQVVRREAIDLLYINGPRLLPVAWFAGDHVPVLFHAHNYLPPGPSRSLSLTVLRGRRIPVIAAGRHVASYLPAERTSIVDNGVAGSEEFTERPQRQGRPRIGMIGRVAPEKGQLDFVDAVRELAEPGWSFAIYGAPMLASPDYGREVMTRAAGLPVEFMGWQEDVASALSALDLLVVPSVGSDAQPRVVLEAFAAGTPVLAYPCGGLPDLIEDGRTGYLTSRSDPAELAARIRLLMTATEKAALERVAQAARERWATRHTLEHYRAAVTRAMAQAANRISKPDPYQTGE